MRFVCDSCNAQYMISDDKVGAKGAKGVKIKCKKCGHMILVRPAGAAASKDNGASDAPAADTAAAASASNGADGSAAVGMPASVGTPPSEGLFSGVEEDEIGAVFDQVLSSGPHKIPAGESLGDSPRDTKPYAASAMQKLAAAESEPDEPKAAAPANDWFVAIEDRQVGPLTVEKIKEHWDRGEVGPDSLCWRAGFGDWIPLSEATELASVLAPRPAKPVIVAPAAVAPSTPSAPVESAFSAGAAAKAPRADIPAAPALGAEPPSSGWKPSAASVLASLVKEETDALKPAPKPAPVEEKSAMGGLLDLPPEPAAPRASPVMAAMAAEPMHAPQPAPMQYAPVAPAPAYAQPAPAYPQPAYAAGYPQPAYPGYPPPGAAVPQGGGNKTALFAGIGAVGVLLLGAVIFLALRGSGSNDTPQQIAAATPQPVQTAPAPAEPPAKAAPANTPPPAEPNPQGAATPPSSAVVAAAGTQPANPGTPPAPASATPPAVTPPTPPPAVAEVKPAEPRTEQPSRTPEREPSRPATRPRGKDEGVAAASSSSSSSKTTKPPADDGLDDDFDSLFGKPKAQQKTQSGSGTGSAPTPYIPPEPGGGGKAQETLAQSDIMAVVLNNKPAIVKCVSEQKKRDPDISGKLVMRWVIQTSGRTTSVSVRSEEFKKTYMASCITGLIKGWSFPKHKKQGDPIDFPFTF